MDSGSEDVGEGSGEEGGDGDEEAPERPRANQPDTAPQPIESPASPTHSEPSPASSQERCAHEPSPGGENSPAVAGPGLAERSDQEEDDPSEGSGEEPEESEYEKLRRERMAANEVRQMGWPRASGILVRINLPN